ncbi:hypothetical protein ACJMK2_036222 [Sinanodonta woodiana]|uniref:Uncharacterized protein n=1 Tax=Sinanodonta woodiana TaxID=1069815 RepID=A0ABD3WIN2_SINWO
MEIAGIKVLTKESEPILRKIKKRTKEIHLSDIPMEISLELTVKLFEEKQSKTNKCNNGHYPSHS